MFLRNPVILSLNQQKLPLHTKPLLCCRFAIIDIPDRQNRPKCQDRLQSCADGRLQGKGRPACCWLCVPVASSFQFVQNPQNLWGGGGHTKRLKARKICRVYLPKLTSNYYLFPKITYSGTTPPASVYHINST